MMHMPMFVLDQLFENREASAAGCPSTSCRSSARAAPRSCSGPRSCAQAPKARVKSPVQEQQPAETVRRANVRELSDTYLLWADLPGLARDDIKVTVADGFLHITGQQKARDIPNDASPEVQVRSHLPQSDHSDTLFTALRPTEVGEGYPVDASPGCGNVYASGHTSLFLQCLAAQSLSFGVGLSS
jgi:hypothetical protein